MSADPEDYPVLAAHYAAKPPMAPTDLEAIVELTAFGAIILTTKPGVVFTADELFAATEELAGKDFGLRRRDFDIVLPFLKELRKVRGGYQLR